MKPTKTTSTKRTKAVKKPRKPKVKRAYDSKSVVGRLLKLKYRINDAYNNRQENDGYTRSDRDWIFGIISEAKDGLYSPNDLRKANTLWKKYNGGVEPTDKNMWVLIDELLTLPTPSKISAIKLYRKFTNSNLREAKEVIDARQEKIKRGW